MRHAIYAAILLCAGAAAAHANCSDDINTALDQARALPPSTGKPMVLENIERARNDHHDGDEQACQEQIDEVLALLKDHKKAVEDASAAAKH